MKTEETMKRVILSLILLAILPLAAACTGDVSAKPTQVADRHAAQVARGQYLVNFGGCHDCHTPLKMGPKGPEPDMARMLSGHPHDLVMTPPPKTEGPWMATGSVTLTAGARPWGISYARNLTPDRVSGLGIWTEDMFVKTMRTGRHRGVSRPILPPMPWQNLNKLSDEDLKSIFAYLRTVKPVRNEVPDPVIVPPPPAAPAS